MASSNMALRQGHSLQSLGAAAQEQLNSCTHLQRSSSSSSSSATRGAEAPATSHPILCCTFPEGQARPGQPGPQSHTEACAPAAAAAGKCDAVTDADIATFTTDMLSCAQAAIDAGFTEIHMLPHNDIKGRCGSAARGCQCV